jgi:hypothetical protein
VEFQLKSVRDSEDDHNNVYDKIYGSGIVSRQAGSVDRVSGVFVLNPRVGL